jgi:anhydro-N-acetylmuramic acid kinase
LKKKASYKVIGLMSGTSLDGIDIAYCDISFNKGLWKYNIGHAETIPYPKQWKIRLEKLEKSNALEFVQTDVQYGHYLGKHVHTFIKKYTLKPNFVSSHGHTIFHQPNNSLSTQIGNGAAISAECNLPVVCDFRSKDIALGGQGAPLVPIGDALLFPENAYCLNLGGFANISFDKNGKRLAFDICPVNIVLNLLSNKLGKKYDENGNLARKGKINEILLKKLNQLPYYKQKPPKSLGREWVMTTVAPLLQKSGKNPFDLLRTYTEHAAMQIASVSKSNSLFVTGGGAYNGFLADRIQYYSGKKISVPDKKTLEFKEALIFAFLGVLRWRNEVNCLSSVTGVKYDHVGGCVYL